MLRTPQRRQAGAMMAAVMLMAGVASGQEAMYTAAATMASPHTFILRAQPHYWSYGSNPEGGTSRTDQYVLDTSIQYGLARGWSATLDVPVSHTRESLEGGGTDHRDGLDQLDLSFKYRFYQNDSGGIDTVRAALIGGVHAAFEDQLHLDPHLGAVVTVVRGRHGFNQELSFRLTTGGDEANNLGGEGPADAFTHNTSYLYRIAPAAYTSSTVGAWYVTIEANGLYETNGDYELRWSPGLMYEGRSFAFELMAQFPLYQDVEHRAELDWGIGFGFRFLY